MSEREILISPSRLSPPEICVTQMGLLLHEIGRTPEDMGVFKVYPSASQQDWSSSGRLNIPAGEVFFDYHLPRTEKIDMDRANESYADIAKQMEARPEVVCILGVTYAVMAKSAVRNQGFTAEEIELSPSMMNLARMCWQEILPDVNPDKHFSNAYVVWHDRQTFLRRFLIQNGH